MGEKVAKERKMVDMELCSNKKTYIGRLLGLVDDSEFYRILNSKRTQNKVFSSQTKPLKEIAGYTRLDGLRLVIAIKEIDGESIGGKHLFITERLNMVGNVETDQQVGILGEEDEYIIISERRV